ncbi:hypothetical protein TSUD_335460 [Trifolium subterraneum]|uniref:Uncharacterized protein n=1 Tax=Trifolium subterraneum TaxID=3900 RepID=A0A2Z6LS16_TRISU|nr:hypothetical protein TSUD_335460 [Trifolium subterraneum]
MMMGQPGEGAGGPSGPSGPPFTKTNPCCFVPNGIELNTPGGGYSGKVPPSPIGRSVYLPIPRLVSTRCRLRKLLLYKLAA